MAYANVPEHVAAQRGEIINRHKQLAAKHAAAPEAQKQGIKRDMDVLHDRHERLMQPYQVKQAKAADLATEARSNGRGTGAPIGGGKVGKVNIDNAVEVEGEKEKVRNAGRAAANGGVVGAAQIRANIAAAGGEKATSAPPISETPASSVPAPKAKAVKKASPESRSGPVTVTKVASNETKAAAPAPVAAPAASAPAPSRAAAVPAEGTPSGAAPTPTSGNFPASPQAQGSAALSHASVGIAKPKVGDVTRAVGNPKAPASKMREGYHKHIAEGGNDETYWAGRDAAKAKRASATPRSKASTTPVEQGPVTAAPPAASAGPSPASTPAPAVEAKPDSPRRMPAAPVAPAAANPTGRERSAPVATPAAPAAPRTTTSPTSPSAAPSSPAPTPARVAPAQATTLNPSQTAKAGPAKTAAPMAQATPGEDATAPARRASTARTQTTNNTAEAGGVHNHYYGNVSHTTNNNVNYGHQGSVSQGGGSMPGGRGGGMPSHATGGGESPSHSAPAAPPVRGKAGILGTLAYAATNSTLNGRSVNGAVHEATGKHIEYHDASGARLGDSKTDAEKHAREHHAAGMARSSARYDEATRVNTGKKAPKLVP